MEMARRCVCAKSDCNAPVHIPVVFTAIVSGMKENLVSKILKSLLAWRSVIIRLIKLMAIHL